MYCEIVCESHIYFLRMATWLAATCWLLYVETDFNMCVFICWYCY